MSCDVVSAVRGPAHHPSSIVLPSLPPSQPTWRRADARSSFRGPSWLPGRRACTGDNRNCCQAAACAEAAPPRVRSGEGARAPAPNLDLMAVQAQITIGPNAPHRACETSSSSLGQRTSHKAVKEGGAARSMCARAAGVCASGGRPQGCMHGCHLGGRVRGAWRAPRADPSRVVVGPTAGPSSTVMHGTPLRG